MFLLLYLSDNIVSFYNDKQRWISKCINEPVIMLVYLILYIWLAKIYLQINILVSGHGKLFDRNC